MKMKRYRGLVLLLMGTMLFSGCQEAPYELTAEEEALIVSYSTHIVSKYNIYQKDGLTYVADKEEETELATETEASTQKADESTESAQTPETTPSVGAEDTEEAGVEASFASVYEDTGLVITYGGYEIADSYMDSSSYAAKPSIGKQFLVLKLNVENQTEEAVEFINFGSGTSYSAKFMMDSGKRYNASSAMTLVSKEFSTYEGTIEAQTVVEMVLLFEIPAEITEIDDLILKINRNDEVFEINL